MTRSGFVLVLSLLLTLALSLVGLGIMAMAIRESGIARALDGRERALALAESAAIGAVLDWTTRAHDSLGIGESMTLPDPTARVTVVRIDTALYLVRTTGTSAPSGASGWGMATARAGLMVRTFDPGRALAYFPAAVSARGQARIDAGLVRGGDSCRAGPAVWAPDVLVGAASVIGEILERAASSDPDPFPPEVLAAASVRVGPGRIRPLPLSTAIGCQPHPGNWGAIAPGHPCRGLLPLIAATGPLRVTGGVGRGILVVDGDLILESGFRFHGLILVRGRALLREQAVLEGAIHADSLALENARVLGAPCSLPEILASPALDRAFRPPSRWWVPAF